MKLVPKLKTSPSEAAIHLLPKRRIPGIVLLDSVSGCSPALQCTVYKSPQVTNVILCAERISWSIGHGIFLITIGIPMGKNNNAKLIISSSQNHTYSFYQNLGPYKDHWKRETMTQTTNSLPRSEGWLPTRASDKGCIAAPLSLWAFRKTLIKRRFYPASR